MNKIIDLLYNIKDYYERNKVRFTVISLSILAIISIGVVSIISISNYRYEKELEQLKIERLKDTKENKSDEEKEKDEKRLLGDLYYEKEDSNLSLDDINITSLFTQDEVKTHALAMLSINNEETRLVASSDLPLGSRARKGVLVNKYTGEELQNFSVNIDFIGLDYKENTTKYEAVILGKTSGTDKEGEIKEKVFSLTLIYSDNEIEDWKWIENE